MKRQVTLERLYSEERNSKSWAPVILATQEVEIRRITVQSQPQEK
jgi:hypothetical protein